MRKVAAHEDFHPKVLPNFVGIGMSLQFSLQHRKVGMTNKKSVRSNLVDQLVVAEKLVDETQHGVTRGGVVQYRGGCLGINLANALRR